MSGEEQSSTNEHSAPSLQPEDIKQSQADVSKIAQGAAGSDAHVSSSVGDRKHFKKQEVAGKEPAIGGSTRLIADVSKLQFLPDGDSHSSEALRLAAGRSASAKTTMKPTKSVIASAFNPPTGPAADRDGHAEHGSNKRKLPATFDDDEPPPSAKRKWGRKPICIHCWQHGETCDYNAQCKPCMDANRLCERRLCKQGTKCKDHHCPYLHPEQYDKSNPAWLLRTVIWAGTATTLVVRRRTVVIVDVVESAQ